MGNAISDSALDQLLVGALGARGIDLRGYRRATVEDRIAKHLERLGCPDIAHYLDRLREDPREYDRLIDCITINVSSFFRNPLVFETLAHDVLPEILERKEAAGARELRVWSAGCAAGEEPYSVAILIHEALKALRSDWTLHFFATDIDETALGEAASAAYTVESLANVKLSHVENFFSRRNDRYVVQPCIREMVRFSQEDVTSQTRRAPAESVFGTLDLVLCRNVTIYFEPPLQKYVTNKLVSVLGDGGYLVLGEAECLQESLTPLFDLQDSRNRIYRKRLGADGLG